MKRSRKEIEREDNDDTENIEDATIQENEGIPCDGIGEIIYIDEEDRKFYAAFQTCDLVVKLGDCVRILLTNKNGESEFAFGQILAIYETVEEEIFVEVRWFSQPDELPEKKKLPKVQFQDNELIETDHLDDIPAGAVQEVIQIKGANTKSGGMISSDHFICRSLLEKSHKSLQPVVADTMLARGMEYSHYREYYASYLQSNDGMLDDYSIAIQRLQISVIPDDLPCRENEKKFIDNYIRDVVVSHRTKAPLYICGMPGTGKTATVLSVINSLGKEVEAGIVPEFDFIEINCLRLKSPADAYTQLWRGLTGYHVSAKVAQQRLSSFFASNEVRIKTVGITSRERVLICLMDELDFLLTRDFRVIYNLFDWSMHERSGFLLISISNTTDLPERVSARVESRTAINIQRQIFKNYNHSEVEIILRKRISNLSLMYLDPLAIELISRRASHTVSDLRAALQICQNTLAMFRDFLKEKGELVVDGHSSSARMSSGGLSHDVKKYTRDITNIIAQAVNKYKLTPFISVISQLPDLYLAILIVFCKHRRIVCGGDEHSASAGMTAIMAWEKFTDFMVHVGIDDYRESAQSSSSGNGTTHSTDPARRINLRLPPMNIFHEALTQLIQKTLLSTTVYYRPCGRPIIIYHLNGGLLYSDLLAATAETPWNATLLKV